MPTYTETDTGLMLPRSHNGHALAESERAYAVMAELYESRIGELEARLQEQGWLHLDSQAGREFSRDAQDHIVELARINYLKNPLIKRAVEIGALYVWGQDLTLNAVDDDVRLVLDRFWRENRSTLTGQQASRLLEVELQVTGNVFLALFSDRMSGSVAVRPVPMEEVRQIVTNPEDRADVWYYGRKWSEQSIDGGSPVQREALYPDWRYRPGSQPDAIGGVVVHWETPLLHVRAGAFPHWRWGVSEVYAALDWAKAYKELLEDDATRSRALARFAWKISTKGGRGAVAAAKTKLGTTLGAGGTGTPETNPPPVTGSAWIQGEGVDLDPIRIAGATLPPDHSRPARLMAASALGLPDTFFGDVDQGTLATAKSLDRPTELRFFERRSMWRDVLMELCQWVIDRDIEATGGILRGRQLDDEERTVDLSWPDLLERSVTERVTAIKQAATLDGQSLAGTIPREMVARQMMVAIGIEDVDGEIAKLEDEWADQDERAAALAQQMQQPPERDEEREAFVSTLKQVQEALRERTR